LLKIDRIHYHSLVDYNANSRVASEDIHVRFICSDQKVDVHGMDNHEIISILLVTAKGVTHYTIGDIIIILHQCIYCRKGTTIHSTG